MTTFYVVFISSTTGQTCIAPKSLSLIATVKMSGEPLERMAKAFKSLTDEQFNDIEADCFWCLSILLEGIQVAHCVLVCKVRYL